MRRILILMIASMVLSACGTAVSQSNTPTTAMELVVPESTPTTAILIPPPVSVPQGEIIRFNGNGPAKSDPFKISEAVSVRINWKFSNIKDFVITIYNLDPNVSDPIYKEPSIKVPYLSSEGYTDYYLIAGEYEIRVSGDGQTWEVWVESTIITQ